MPVIYLPQLLGLAFGLTKEQLGLKHNVVPIETLPALQAEEV
jgi:heterodisulfide reductase subunit B